MLEKLKEKEIGGKKTEKKQSFKYFIILVNIIYLIGSIQFFKTLFLP